MSVSWSFQATGTTWTIEIFEDPAALESLKSAVASRIDDFDKTYSRFRPDSLVAQMSRLAGEYELPQDGQYLFDMYRELYDLTQGRLTPLIGQTMIDAGYDAEYSLQPKPKLSRPPDWDKVIGHISRPGWIKLRQPAQLDFGAIGKGYLVDIISALLVEQGIRHYCVEAGGDLVYHYPGHPTNIGLEDPQREGSVIGQATIEAGALCGSAGNRRRWADFHHTIDPTTGSSPDTLLAIWVYAGSTALADGLTTALSFVSAKALKKQYNFEYILIMSDGTAEKSSGFPGQVYTKATQDYQ